MKRARLAAWPFWILGGSVILLGLALWARWGPTAWMEQVIAWCT